MIMTLNIEYPNRTLQRALIGLHYKDNIQAEEDTFPDKVVVMVGYNHKSRFISGWTN